MPTIKSSADLRNNYNDISLECHTYNEPIYITKNGKGDLVVMSIEACEQLMGKADLYAKLAEGMQDVIAGRVKPLSQAMTEIREKRANR